MTAVLDASALLALLFDEPGAEHVADVIGVGATVSTVNLGEVATVLARNNHNVEMIMSALTDQLTVEPFITVDAIEVASFYTYVHRKGLSFGDRACLALAKRLGAPAITAENIWPELELDIKIELIPRRR